MKKILLVAIAVALSLGFISCKKCITCKYEYLYLNDTVKVSDENCGKSRENKDFEATMEAEAKLQGAYDSFSCEDMD